MPGPCPQGASTQGLHREARCRDRENCTGTGCRVRRPKRAARASAEPETGDA